MVGTVFDIHQDVKNEPLKHFLARQVTPDIGFRFDEIQYEGKRLVVMTIPAAVKVVFISGDGRALFFLVPPA